MTGMTRLTVLTLAGVVAGCAEQPLEPAVPVTAQVTTAALGGTAILLESGGTSSTVLAKAISPRGWILGNWYYHPTRTRAQSWSPDETPVVATVVDTGSVYSSPDAHGDATAFLYADYRLGAAVLLADADSKGAPYAYTYLPDRPEDSPANVIAHAINDDHFVVGWAVGAHAMLWAPTAPGATTWNLPVYLPLPTYPRYSAFGTEAIGINNAGYIVGRVREINNNSSVDHAVLWKLVQVDGTWTGELVDELPRYPHALGHRAEDINDAGVIAGVVRMSRKEFPALWFPDAPGSYTYSSPPVVSGISDWAIGKLNRCGWLAFTSMGSNATGYLWNGTTTVQLPRPSGAASARGYDVNDNGDAVGAARFTPRKQDAYGVGVLWRGAVPACD